MKLTITSMAGNTRNINLESKQQVLDFIELFRATLQPKQRVKITCDVLSIDGYLQGDAQGEIPVCSLIFLYLFLHNTYHTSEKNIQIFVK